MASLLPRTVTLRGDPIASEARAKSSEAIKPGMLVQLHTDGTLKKHSVGGEKTAAAFVREADIWGGSIDDAYEDGETVLYSIFRPGDWVYSFLANNGNVAVGALLESDGAGSLRAGDGAAASRATLTLGATNAAVKFDAVAPGPEGADLQIQILAATAATATVVVTGNLIQIKPNSTTPGTTDTAATVATLVNTDAIAGDLVTATLPGTGASAIVSPVAATNLAGGSRTTGSPICRALEALNNATGSPARLKVEVL